MLFGRPDGTPVPDVPPYRRMMPFLMRAKAESAVTFDQRLDLSRTLPFLESRRAASEADHPTLFHLVLWAITRALDERPRLNRFVAGGRLWQRDGIWLSYSAKKRFDDRAPVVVVKQRMDPRASLEELVRAVRAEVARGKSDERSHTDKELSLLLRLPGPVLSAAVRLVRAVDRLGLLPRAFVEPDPFFASAFVANLGSLGMDAAYHHLYEYGTIPIFCVLGRVKDEALVIDGGVEVRPTAVLRYTYDERIEDGLYAMRSLERVRQLVEDPESATT